MKDILASKKSCYVGSAAEWRRFISAWKLHVPSDYQEYSIVKSIDFHPVNDISRRISAQEKKLGVRFPKSLKDFLCVGEFRKMEAERNGFLNIEEIDWLKNVDEDYYNIMRDACPDDDDSSFKEDQYFKYGKEFFLDANPLPVLLPGAEKYLLVVAKIAVSDYLFLNTQFKSLDGEFEAVYLMPSLLYRYPNFAEMLRQYAAADCGLLDAISPCELEKIDWIGNGLIADPWWN